MNENDFAFPDKLGDDHWLIELVKFCYLKCKNDLYLAFKKKTVFYVNAQVEVFKNKLIFSI